MSYSYPCQQMIALLTTTMKLCSTTLTSLLHFLVPLKKISETNVSLIQRERENRHHAGLAQSVDHCTHESESQHVSIVRGVIINFEETKHLIFSKNFNFILKILIKLLKKYFLKKDYTFSKLLSWMLEHRQNNMKTTTKRKYPPKQLGIRTIIFAIVWL